MSDNSLAETVLHDKFQTDSDARSGCELAAEHIVSKCGGSWRWIDDKTLRIFTDKGEAAMTFSMESTQ